MKKFNLNIDQKVTIWHRTSIVIEANSLEEATEKMKVFGSIESQFDDVCDTLIDENIITDRTLLETEYLYDAVENISIEENGNAPTIEVLYDGEVIIRNSEKTPEKYSLGDDKIILLDTHEEVLINREIFDYELFEYKICHRESLIDDLMHWISEESKDKMLMKKDLEMLLRVPDEYIFSSISTNDYIMQADTRFGETCEELLEIQKIRYYGKYS